MAVFPQYLLDIHDELIVDLFAGGGGASLGIEMATGRQVDVAINHDAAAVAMHQANHPQTKHHTCDIWEVDPREATDGRPVGFLWASPDCFPAGTLILTDQGYLPIEEVRVGDVVLTHRGRYRRVTETMRAERPLVTVKGQGHPGLEVSPEHPFYMREAHNVWNNAERHYDRTLTAPVWTKARDLRTHGAPMNAAGGDLSFWATPCEFPPLRVPEVGGRGMTVDTNLAWLAGRYVGDGWTRITDTRAELVITCSKEEAEDLRWNLDRWPRTGARAGRDELAWHERETRTAVQFSTNHRGLVEWLRSEFGHGAEEKAVPAWLLGGTRQARHSFLDGYLSADGHTRTVSGGEVSAVQTVSKALAIGVRALAESLGYTAHVSGPYENRSKIEGRQVNARPIWNVKWRHELQRTQNVRDHWHNWTRVQAVEDHGRVATVYNLSVDEDESYVAEGVVVHNCTDHSKAKGGKPIRTKKRRALAWVVTRWAEAVRPRVIMLENVEEFVDWAPLVGEPGNYRRDEERKGETFRAFVKSLEDLGYVVEWDELRACKFGAPTIRKRLYLIARCDGEPIVWPEPTHGKGRKPYRSAAECIDWSIPMLSIFADSEEAKEWARAVRKAGWKRTGTPRRPLADATLRRIARGVVRFVINAAEPFIVNLAQRGPREYPIDDPLRTQHAGGNAFGLVAPIVAPNNTNNVPKPASEPVPTITGGGRNILVAPYLIPRYGEREGQKPRVLDAQRPMPTIVPTGNHAQLVSAFLTKHYGGVVGTPLDTPAGTVTTIDHHALTAASLAKLRGTSSDADPAEPLHTISAGGNHHAAVAAFLQKYYGEGVGQTLDDPAATVTTKDRMGLVTVQIRGEPYVLTDIAMRMLQPRELYRAQGFTDDYVIRVRFYDAERGKERWLTKAEQVRMVGNSVSPQVVAALVRANCPELAARDEVAA